MRAIILPGNGCTNVRQSNWYGWLEDKLVKDQRFDSIILKDMPDPIQARRKIWLPFIKDKLLENEHAAADTIAIGHSSGAVAAMRLCETTKLAGLVLVAACHSDLGCRSERQAGWYPPSGGDWEWSKIYENAGNGNITLLHSQDDPFIPISEPRFVASSLGGNVNLREFEGESHFFYPNESILEAVYDVLEGALQK